MASTTPITTSLSVSFSRDSTSSNVFQLEEYQPKARIDGTLPELLDPAYRYAAVYGNHLKNADGSNNYTLDGYNCSARFIDPTQVSNKVEARCTKIDEQIIVFSGESSYDVNVPGLVQVLEVEQIGKFYQIQGEDVIDTTVTLTYDGFNQRIVASPAGKWYGVARIKYRAEGHLYLVTLDIDRPADEKIILVGSSFYWDEERREYLPVVAYLEFTTDSDAKDARNEIALEEFSPSEGSPYAELVSATVKLVDLYVDHTPYTMEGSTGVVFELAPINGGRFSHTETTIVSFTDATTFTGGSVGSVGAAFVPLILFDSTHKRIDNNSVQFNWDQDSLTFTPKPGGSYTGVGVVSTSRIGYRYKVDITKAPSMSFKDKEGNGDLKKLAVLTARNTYINPYTQETMYGFAEIHLDEGSGAEDTGDNLIQVETIGKDDLRANNVSLNYDQVMVMVYADHPYQHMLRGGGSITRTASGVEETQYTEITFNGDSTAEFKQAALVTGSVTLDTIIMLNRDGSNADVDVTYDEKARKIVLLPKGEYYGVVEVGFKRNGDAYKATLAPYDLNKDGFADGYQSWFIVYSLWKDPATQKSYPTFVSTKLSTTANPQYELNNQLSIQKFEKALGKKDAPLSRREQFYKVRASFGGIGSSSIEPINCSIESTHTQEFLERNVVTVSGGNSISVGPGLKNYELTQVGTVMNEKGESVGWSDYYNSDSQQIFIGGENEKLYGVFFLKAAYEETLVKVLLSPEIDEVRDRGYSLTPDHIGALVVHDVRYNPYTGEPVMAYAYTEVSNERDEDENDGDAPGKGMDEFHFLIEEDPASDPIVNDNIKTVCYLLKIYPCPTGTLGKGLAGGNGNIGTEDIIVSGDSKFSMAMTYTYNPVEDKFMFDTGVPYKSSMEVKTSSFVNNSSKITLTYPPTSEVVTYIAKGSKMLDTFGIDWTEMVVVRAPGQKYKSLSWKKVLTTQGNSIGGYMVPELGGLSATYNTVGPYELVICVEFETEALGKFYAEIPLIGSVGYEYWTSFGKIAAFWDADLTMQNSREMDMYYGKDKVFNVLGKWDWYGKQMLASGNHSISKKSPTQKTTKGTFKKLPEKQE